jgi:hypothetical protein
MIYKLLLLFLICIGANACVSMGDEKKEGVILDVSRVIDSRSTYYGKNVTVVGYLSTQSENLHLFETAKQFRNRDYKRCLNISFDPKKNYYDDRKRYHKRIVVVTGLLGPIDKSFFDTGGCGDLGISVDEMSVK